MIRLYARYTYYKNDKYSISSLAHTSFYKITKSLLAASVEKKNKRETINYCNHIIIIAIIVLYTRFVGIPPTNFTDQVWYELKHTRFANFRAVYNDRLLHRVVITVEKSIMCTYVDIL